MKTDMLNSLEQRGLMDRVLVLHYHEIWLKGGNRNFFVSRLAAAVKHSLAEFPIESFRHVSERLVLTPENDSDIPAMLERLRRIFGLAYIAPARKISPDLSELAPAACELMAERDPQTFAVRAKIADPAFGMNSMQLERDIGREILTHLRGLGKNVQVNLNNPQTTCWVEVIPGAALLYADRVEGAGGLPAATAGRLVALLSGGFDSAVAAYKVMRRGAHVTFVHFFGTPSPSRNSSKPVAIEILRTLTPYQFSSRLYLVPFDTVEARAELIRRERAQDFDGDGLRGVARRRRSAEEVDKRDVRSPAHDLVGRHGGIESSGEQCHQPAGRRRGKAARPFHAVGVEKRRAGNHLDPAGRLRVVQVDLHVFPQPAEVSQNLAPNVAFELHGVHSEGRVGDLGADRKRLRVPLRHQFAGGGGEFGEVRRNFSRRRDVGEAENAPQTFEHGRDVAVVFGRQQQPLRNVPE